jgi:hypothetical protein
MDRHTEGTNADGTVKYRYELTEADRDAGYVAFATGPIAGTFVIDDETYDCTPHFVAVKAEHADHLAWLIHSYHHAHGNFLETPLPGDGSLEAYKAACEASRVDLGHTADE